MSFDGIGLREFVAYDQHFYAATALIGTFVAAQVLFWSMRRPRWAEAIAAAQGIVPPFINVIGVLFGLTLAFIANDAWSAHERALDGVRREADALRNLQIFAQKLPDPEQARLRGVLIDYARSAAAEWPLLAGRTASPEAARTADALLSLLAARPIEDAVGASLSAIMLGQGVEARENRQMRLALSQTHINPLKWLGMALLGLATMISVAAAHIGAPRAAAFAVALFAIAAAPMAAIVLAQSNPFAPPMAVAPAPFLELIEAATPN